MTPAPASVRWLPDALRSYAQPASVGVGALAYRPALDGLRGVAVLAVLAYHLEWPWARGGFLGVDMFFVLSGYLITTLLLAEHARTGRISLAEFWARRVRRLLPALLVVCGAVAFYAGVAAPREQLSSLRWDLLGALSYVANWRFILSEQSYFDAFAAPSPLRHTWSLAIEEQFYLLWPLLVLLLLGIGRGRLRPLRLVAFVVGVASVLSQFLLYDSADGSRAYYGTDARVHELLIGALLAMALARRRGAHRSGPPQCVAGLATGAAGAIGVVLLSLALVRLPDDTPVYYLGGSLVLSVAFAAVLLNVELAPQGRLARRVSWRPLVAVGKVSYGLYLWHWPVQVWLTEDAVPLTGLALDILRIAVTAALTWASYVFVELPIRRGAPGGFRLSPPRLGLLAPAATTGVVLLALVATLGARPAPAAGDVRVAEEPAVSGRGATVALVGDSVAESLVDGFEPVAKANGWTLVPAAFPGCPAAAGFQLDADGKPLKWSQDCAEQVPVAQRAVVAEHDPDVVVWYSTRELNSVRQPDGTVLAAGTLEHWADVRRRVEQAVDRLTAGGAHLVIELPAGVALVPRARCGDADNPCVKDADPATVRRLTEVLEDVAAERRGRVSTDTALRELLCGERVDACPAEVDGEKLRPDGFHFTPETAPRVAEAVAAPVRRITSQR